MNSCSVEYDLLTSGNENWWFPALGLIAGGMALFVYLILRYIARKSMTPFKKLVAVLPVFLSLGWAIAALLWVRSDYNRLAQAYERGDYREISGSIQDVVDSGPGRQSGDESFEVDGLRFSYSKYIVSPGFRKTRASGGPIRVGRMVRIRYIGNAIVRLEICGEEGVRLE